MPDRVAVVWRRMYVHHTLSDSDLGSEEIGVAVHVVGQHGLECWHDDAPDRAEQASADDVMPRNDLSQHLW